MRTRRLLAAAGLLIALPGCTGAPTAAPAAMPTPSAPVAAPSTAPTPSASTPTGPTSAPGPAPAVAMTRPRPAAGAPAGPSGQLHRRLLRFPTGYQPKQVAFSPSGDELWVTPLGSAAGVEVFDARTGRRTHRVDLGRHGAVELAFTRDGATAYVSQMETGSVFAIDARTYRVTRRYPTQGVWTKVVALSPDERTLYASN